MTHDNIYIVYWPLARRVAVWALAESGMSNLWRGNVAPPLATHNHATSRQPNIAIKVKEHMEGARVDMPHGR